MRGKKNIFAAKCAVLLAAVPVVVYSFSGGPPVRKSGVPGEGRCSECHGGGNVSGSVEVRFPGDMTYTPGMTQTLRVVVNGAAARYGFQLTARLASDERNGQAGSLSPAAGESGIIVLCANEAPRGAGGCPAGNEVEHIEHSSPRTTGEFNVDWTPPATDRGPVRIYVAANAANGNFQPTGDTIFSTSYTLNPAPAGGGPTISSNNGVVNGASFQPGITPGAWVSIFGENLAPTSRRWRDSGGDSEIIDGVLPTSLDGVGVMIDGRPAAVSFISPAQVNVQVPDGIGTGSAVPVRITTAQGTSEVTATSSPAQPGLFKFDTTYVAAQHGDFTNVGPQGRFGAGTRPAARGAVVILYGTGFGQTTPATPAGRVVSTQHQIDKSQLQVTIGGQDAPVEFAGITIAGVWQLNVRVPSGLTPGDHPVIATLGGRPSQDGAALTVE